MAVPASAASSSLDGVPPPSAELVPQLPDESADLREVLPTMPQNIDEVPALQFSGVQRGDEFGVETLDDDYYRLCMEKNLQLDTRDDNENLMRVQKQELAQKEAKIEDLKAALLEREAQSRKQALNAIKEVLQHVSRNLEGARLRLYEMLDVYVSRPEREAAEVAAQGVRWFSDAEKDRGEDGPLRRHLDEVDSMFRFYFEEVQLRWAASRTSYVLQGGTPGADFRALWQQQRGQIAALSAALHEAAKQVDVGKARLKARDGALNSARVQQDTMRSQFIRELFVKTERLHMLDEKLAQIAGQGHRREFTMQFTDLGPEDGQEEEEEEGKQEEDEEAARKRQQQEREELMRQQLLSCQQRVKDLDAELRDQRTLVAHLREELARKWERDESEDQSTPTPDPGGEPSETPRSALLSPANARGAEGELGEGEVPTLCEQPPPEGQIPPEFSPKHGDDVEVWCNVGGVPSWAAAVVGTPGEGEYPVRFPSGGSMAVSKRLMRPAQGTATSSELGAGSAPSRQGSLGGRSERSRSAAPPPAVSSGAARTGSSDDLERAPSVVISPTPSNRRSPASPMATPQQKRRGSHALSMATAEEEPFIEVLSPAGTRQGSSIMSPRKSGAHLGRRGSSRKSVQVAGADKSDPYRDLASPTHSQYGAAAEESVRVRELQDALIAAEDRASDLERTLAMKSTALAELEAKDQADRMRRRMSTRAPGGGLGKRSVTEDFDGMQQDNARLKQEVETLTAEVERLTELGANQTADTVATLEAELHEAVVRAQQHEAVNNEFRALNSMLRDQLLAAEERIKVAEEEAMRYTQPPSESAPSELGPVAAVTSATKAPSPAAAPAERQPTADMGQEEVKRLTGELKRSARRADRMRMIIEDARSQIMGLRALQRKLIGDYRAFMERHRGCTQPEDYTERDIDMRLFGTRGVAGESTIDILRRLVLDDMLQRNRTEQEKHPFDALVLEALERGRLPAEYLLHFLTPEQLEILHQEATQTAPGLLGCEDDAQASAVFSEQAELYLAQQRLSDQSGQGDELEKLRAELRMLKDTLGLGAQPPAESARAPARELFADLGSEPRGGLGEEVRWMQSEVVADEMREEPVSPAPHTVQTCPAPAPSQPPALSQPPAHSPTASAASFAQPPVSPLEGAVLQPVPAAVSAPTVGAAVTAAAAAAVQCAEQSFAGQRARLEAAVVSELLRMPLDDVCQAAPKFHSMLVSLPAAARAGVRREWALGAATPSGRLREAISSCIAEGIIPTTPELRPDPRRPSVGFSATAASSSDFAAALSPSQLSSDAAGTPQSGRPPSARVQLTPSRALGWPMASSPSLGAPRGARGAAQRLTAARSRIGGVEALRSCLVQNQPVAQPQEPPPGADLPPPSVDAAKEDIYVSGSPAVGGSGVPQQSPPLRLPQRPLSAKSGWELSAKRRKKLERILLDSFDDLDSVHQDLDVFELFALIKVELHDLVDLHAQLAEQEQSEGRAKQQGTAAGLEQDRQVLLARFKIFRAIETYTSLILFKMRRRKENLLRAREETLSHVLEALGHVAITHPREARELLCVAQQHGRRGVGADATAERSVPLLVQLSRRQAQRQDDLREALLELAKQETERLKCLGISPTGPLQQGQAVRLSPLSHSATARLVQAPRPATAPRSGRPPTPDTGGRQQSSISAAAGPGLYAVGPHTQARRREWTNIVRGRVKPRQMREGRPQHIVLVPQRKRASPPARAL